MKSEKATNEQATPDEGLTTSRRQNSTVQRKIASNTKADHRQDNLAWWRWAALLIFPGHLLLTALTMGIRTEHLLLDGVFLGLVFLGGRWRSLSYRCVPFFLTAFAYDNGRYTQHLRGKIHVSDIYFAELKWFGVNTANGRKILPEFFRTYNSTVLDLLSGFAYIIYLYEIIGLGIYLFFRDERRMGRLTWSFFLVNLMGLVTYLIFPVAPPWYVEQYGLGPALVNAKPSAAGAIRFDNLLGINYFKNFYARNPNVFGAMPSLHVAYPVICLCATATMGTGWVLGTSSFALLVAFSAVYLRHHYVLDVLVGALFSLLAHGAMSLQVFRNPTNNQEEVASDQGTD